MPGTLCCTAKIDCKTDCILKRGTETTLEIPSKLKIHSFKKGRLPIENPRFIPTDVVRQQSASFKNRNDEPKTSRALGRPPSLILK